MGVFPFTVAYLRWLWFAVHTGVMSPGHACPLFLLGLFVVNLSQALPIQSKNPQLPQGSKERAAKCPRGHGSFSFYPLLWVFFLCLLWEPSFFQQPCLPSNIGCEILKRSRPVLLWQCYSKVPIIVERNKSRFSTCFITSALKWTFWTKQISPPGSCMMWL